MPATVAPSAEACQVIVDRINSGSTGDYTLPTDATYAYEISEDLTDVSGLEVTVVHEDERDLNETLDVEQRTSHALRVWIRKKPADKSLANVNAVKLIARLIFQRLNLLATNTSRVKVYECNQDPEAWPDKDVLREYGVVSMAIVMRVEVEPSL